MARYNFIAENDIDFIVTAKSQAPSTLHFRGTDLNYLACKYAIHRKLNPPATTIEPAGSDFAEADYEDDAQRSGWLNRLFQRLATLGESQRLQG